MPGVPDRGVDRVLVVVAHPDDAEFWAGGSIARWTDAGSEVTYCVLSDGEAGGFDPATPRTQIPHRRKCPSGDDGVDCLFQRAGLGRGPRRFVPGLLELGSEFL